MNSTKNMFKSNLGIIILSISIIITGTIISETFLSIDQNKWDRNPSQMNQSLVRINGGPSVNRVPVDISTNGNDVTYKNTLTVGENFSLVVKASNGTTEKIVGKNIKAFYFHVGKLLTVEYEFDGEKIFKYYNSPISWQTTK